MEQPKKRRLISTKNVLRLIAAGVIAVSGLEANRVRQSEKAYTEAVSIAEKKGISSERLSERRREIWDSMGISRPPEGKVALTAFYAKMIHRSLNAERQLLNEVKSGKLLKIRKPKIKEKPNKLKPGIMPQKRTSTIKLVKHNTLPRSNLPQRRRRA